MNKADYQQLDALLRAQDEPQMPRRAHHITQCGHPNRRAEIGIPLITRWYVSRIVMREEGETR